MINKFKSVFMIFFAAAVMLLSVSCATSIAVDVTRPAELDLNGANSISVLPFKPSEYYGHYDPHRGYVVSILDFFFGFDDASPDEKELLRTLQDKIVEGLLDSDYLKLISADATKKALENGTEVPADVYLTGEVTRFDVREEPHERRRKLPPKKHDDEDESEDEPEFVLEEFWVRDVDFDFRYEIVDSTTDEIISYKSVHLHDSDEADNPRDLEPPALMLRYDVESIARRILKEIQPYVVTKSITLLKYKDHAGFEYADNLAKDGLISESCDKFYDIYTQEGIFEAGYNAALLFEAQGNLDEAKELMESLLTKGTSKQRKNAVRALSDINNEIAQAEKLDKQNQDRSDREEN